MTALAIALGWTATLALVGFALWLRESKRWASEVQRLGNLVGQEAALRLSDRAELEAQIAKTDARVDAVSFGAMIHRND